MQKTDVKKMWELIVTTGKKQKRLKDLGYKEGRINDSKYFNECDMDNTGAITVEDAEWLYNKTIEIKPVKILDIGTWFGTSAFVMAQAMKDVGSNGKVYSCDKHNVRIDNHQYDIVFYNGMSTNFLKTIHVKSIDFVFCDAILQEADPAILIKCFKNRVRFATHDYDYGKKGMRNIEKIMKMCFNKKIQLIVNNKIAYLEELYD